MDSKYIFLIDLIFNKLKKYKARKIYLEKMSRKRGRKSMKTTSKKLSKHETTIRKNDLQNSIRKNGNF